MTVKLPVFSPTALKLADPWRGGCLRAYAFRYIDRIRLSGDDAPWLAQGVRFAKVLELARLGTSPDLEDLEARVAAAVIDYWPEGDWKPEIPIRVERDGHAFEGIPDQFGAAFVGDYKFTGDLKNMPDGRPQWVKTLWPREKTPDDQLVAEARATLLRDAQWIIYGRAALDLAWSDLDEDPEACVGQWYYIRKPPKLKGVPKILTVPLDAAADEIEEGLQHFDNVAKLCIYVRATYTRAIDVPHQADTACGGLGIRCDYAPYCDQKGPEDMASLAELMAKAKIQTETPKVNPPESAAVDPTEAPAAAPPPEPAAETPAETKPPKERKKRDAAPQVVNEATDAAPGAEGAVFAAERAQDTGEVFVRVHFPAGTIVPVGGKVRIV